jgi:hypothetical protein
MIKFYVVVESNQLDANLEAYAITTMNYTQFHSLEAAQIEKIRKDEDLNCNSHILEVIIQVSKV